jgi:hypothetical protein
MSMLIEDRRKKTGWFDVRNELKVKIGDVVETEDGRVALITWASLDGQPYNGNPGYNGLTYLTGNCMSHVNAGHVNAGSYPLVRKLKAHLVIEDE